MSGRWMRGARRGAAVTAVVMIAAGCSRAPATAVASVDGGADGVALLGDVVVATDPGGTVTIEHAGAPATGEAAPVTHAFVGGAGDALPALFVKGQGGSIPNAAVWGGCAGGDVAEARGACPVAPVDAPAAWDGAAYWSTGAMLPGETRVVPLAEALPDGDLVLVCALHPALRVVIRPGGDAPATEPAPVEVDTALELASAQPPAPATVAAGVEVDGAYVGRFVPAEIRIAAGESVTWVAGSRAPVDVVFNGGDLDLAHTTPADGVPAGRARGWNGRGELRSGFLSVDPDAGAAGTRWRVTFSRPGRYEYASRFGSALQGAVVVEAK